MTTADKRAELLQIAIKTDVVVDRWDNIKYHALDNLYRYKFKKNVIRKEVKSGSTWVRLKSYNISKVNNSSWQTVCDQIYDAQNNVRV